MEEEMGAAAAADADQERVSVLRLLLMFAVWVLAFFSCRICTSHVFFACQYFRYHLVRFS